MLAKTTASPTGVKKEPLMTVAANKAAAAPTAAPTGGTGFDPKQYKDLATGSQIKAETTAFDESKGVAGRVNDLVTESNPLMQTAMTRAAQQANAKGLRNSSMAVQAGQQAVIETATPIATADANLFTQQQLANQNARNSTNQFNSNARTTIGLEGAKAGETEGQFSRELGERSRQFDTEIGEQGRQFDASAKLDYAKITSNEKMAALEATTRKTLAQMDADNRIKLSELEAGYKKEIAGNENIANAWGTMMTNINQLQNNPDLDANAKRTNIENQIQSFQSFTNFWKKATGGTVNVQDLLNFGVDAGGKPPVNEVPGTGGKKDNDPPFGPVRDFIDANVGGA